VDRELHERGEREGPAPASVIGDGQAGGGTAGHEDLHAVVPGAVPIGALSARQKACVVGRVRSLTVRPWGDVPSLEVQLADEHGKLVVAFLGRREIAGLSPGSQIAVEGMVALLGGQLTMINPEYEFVAPSRA
jgi:hypothetical protein